MIMLVAFVIVFIYVLVYVFTKLSIQEKKEAAEQEAKNKAAAVQREKEKRNREIASAAIAAGLPMSQKDKYTESWSRSRMQSCKVAGVTFKNGRRHRQTILRQIKFHDGPYEYGPDIRLVRTEFNGEPAIEVWANEEQVGYISKEDLPEVLKRWSAGNVSDSKGPSTGSPNVYGGNLKEDGSRTNYGMEFKIFWPEESCPRYWLNV